MRLTFYGALMTSCLAFPAVAQTSLAQAQVNLQFREPIPANGDISTARSAVLTDAEQSCAALQKAFNLPCSINTIQFNGPGMGMPFPFQQQPPGNFLNANVS